MIQATPSEGKKLKKRLAKIDRKYNPRSHNAVSGGCRGLERAGESISGPALALQSRRQR